MADEKPVWPILEHANHEYEGYTGQASTVLRSLLITALGLVWLFAGGLTHQPQTPEETFALVGQSGSLSTALWTAIAGLAADLLQYVIGAVGWGAYRWTWNTVLYNDDYQKSADESWRLRVAWSIASPLQITRMIRAHDLVTERDGDVVERRGFSENTAEARAVLLRDGARELTDSIRAPVLLNFLPVLLFGLKLLLGVVTYLALVIGVS